MTRFDTIETKRLALRRWQDADRAPFAELNGDPETLVFFPSTLTRAESDSFVDRMEARFAAHGYGLWALEVRETGQFIGFTGLAPMPDDVPGAGGTEIGWRLARPAWHHGYATEAALAARDVAFTGVGLPELWSMTAVLNTPSQAVMRRIGMTEAARFEHPRVPDGNPLKPHVVYHLASPGTGALVGARSGRASLRVDGAPDRLVTPDRGFLLRRPALLAAPARRFLLLSCGRRHRLARTKKMIMLGALVARPNALNATFIRIILVQLGP